jgi:hypothetical protein
MGELMQRKLAAGLKPGLTSCRTGFVGGYVVEGHVPAREVRRLLAERPEAVGLAVPDMPLGSPGMEADKTEPYDVLLVHWNGSPQIYARYPSPSL